mmetsp:Transcript_23552/g.73632  ORF Transcript_23552/g.73632 Transcript_23552/m.73632 type:complete len:92 (+) Transcript_23552:1073-1348(+)
MDGRAPGDDQPWGDDVVAGREPAPRDMTPDVLEFHPRAGDGPYRIWLRVNGGYAKLIDIEDLKVHCLHWRQQLHLVGPGGLDILRVDRQWS